MSKIIAVCNQKGGVGKTTTAINLGADLAFSGDRVLLIDLDPQANATGGLGIDKKGVSQSIYQAIFDGVPMGKAVLTTKIPNLWLVPSQTALSGAEVELVSLPAREERLRSALTPLRSSYDWILIDSPPSLGLLTVNALTAADSILIPLQCEYYALEGLSQLLETVRLVKEHLNPALSMEGILLTMADFRTKLTNDVIQEVRRFFGSQVYDLVIPRSVRLSEAPSHGLPIHLYDPQSAGAKAYRLLAERIKSCCRPGETGSWQPRQEEKNADARESWTRQRDTGSDSGGAPAVQEDLGGADQSSSGGDPAQSIPAA
ncbi:MAG: AAA family ATPase [Candidatus Omnitrophica bacterium]|nr:AAA family ATPase [Candidatus Omnitrophota bacterium]